MTNERTALSVFAGNTLKSKNHISDSIFKEDIILYCLAAIFN